MNMSKYLVNFYVLIISIYVFTGCGNNSKGDDAFDAENNSATIEIKKEVWSEINLETTTFKNGDLIPQASTNEDWQNAILKRQPAWCYYNNDSMNNRKLGKLYNWYAINDKRGIIPNGWHIPSNEEWKQLIINKSAKELKNTSGWKNGENGTNEINFSAFPGGFRKINGEFYADDDGFWWSSNEASTNFAWCFILPAKGDDGVLTNYYKGAGFSVRCVKDN
jgi:uncharacterized protein (TIGR02145 family)